MSKSKHQQKGELCPYCGEFYAFPGFYQHKPSCRELYQKNHLSDPIEQSKKQQEQAKHEHGYSNLNTIEDFFQESADALRKAGVITSKEESEINELGFTKSFYKFVGLGRPNDYLHPPTQSLRSLIGDMRDKTALCLNTRSDTAQSFYTPMDDMYGSATGSDTWYDYGRIPISHLETLASKRIGVLFTACNRPAVDILDNGFEFVKLNDPDGDAVETPKTTTIFRWMRKTHFYRKIMDIVDFDARSGLGHLIASKYQHEKGSNWSIKAPNTKPESFTTFSPYYMTPINTHQPNLLDYDKQLWNFNGGLNGSTINHTRVYTYEGLREPLGLRGLALGELCWIANMCYLNLQYYILKSLAQLGTVIVGINVDREMPSTAETAKYLELMKTMKANNFYVLGRGAQLTVENAAAKLGTGINDFMEFLKEDMSAAWTFPKNQLFGRAQGGGLDGAGAIVSKEDYIASNLSVKQSKVKPCLMYILQEMVGFGGLDNLDIRFNIDLHKTSEQRYKEQSMKEQVRQQQIVTEQMEMSQPLYKDQIKLQQEMAKIQSQMLKENPEEVMGISNKDEENLSESEVQTPKKDFIRYKKTLQLRYDFLLQQWQRNNQLIKYIQNDTNKLKLLYQQENKATEKLFKP